MTFISIMFKVAVTVLSKYASTINQTLNDSPYNASFLHDSSVADLLISQLDIDEKQQKLKSDTHTSKCF